MNDSQKKPAPPLSFLSAPANCLVKFIFYQIGPGWLAMIFCIAGISVSGSEPGRVQLHGNVPAVVAKLTPIGRLPATIQLRLAIGLPLRDPAGLDALLAQLYDPASTNFHKYLTPPELASRFGPREQDYAAVRQFVESNGLAVAGEYPSRMVLNVEGGAASIERAFHVTLRTYRHPTEPRDFYAPDTEPSVPASLKIVSIEGLNDFYRPRRAGIKMNALMRQPLSFSGTGPNHEYIGNDFRNAYVPGVALNGAGQTVAVLEYSDYFPVDITNYENAVGALNGVTNYVPVMKVVVGGVTPNTGGDDEVSLDIEMAIAMAPRLSQVMVYEESSISSSVLSQIQSDNQAKQVSSSWLVGNWSSSLATTYDNILMLMAAQGQSFFQSSGDGDAYTGGQTLDNGITVPADSPYATIVGGTSLTMSSYGVAWSSETVWNYNNNGIPNEGSGGGVSSYYAQPWWQTNISMSVNGGSTSYRNTPDVALTADNIYACYDDGNTSGSDYFMGTSAAAPLWAGFTALVNQRAAAAGSPPVGFLNPALYAIATNSNYSACFHDIATGNNIGTNTPGLYYATNGYDLCTGLGSPNGINLINALGPPFIAITNAGWSLLAESATPTNGAINPGGTVTIAFTLQNQGTLPTRNLVATLQPNAGVLAPGGPQTYGVVAAFGGTNTQPFTFTASGNCGSNIVAALQLQDGTNYMGTVSFMLPMGAISYNHFQSFAQNFDGVAAPVLPSGWAAVNVFGTANSWTTTAASYDTPPNSAFVSDSASPGENCLVSPVISIVSTNAQLSFRHNYSFDYNSSSRHPYRDGGVLEIQIGSGSFQDILAAGGSFVTGGYNNAINSSSNPLAGRSAWVNSSGGWQSVTVELPASAAGQNIQLRWNCVTDNGNLGTGAVGWYVDTVSITDTVTTATCLSVFTELAASQSLATNSFQAGQNLVYTLAVTNFGPQLAANVVLTDTVPANATFISASPGYSYVTGQIIWSVGMMAAAASTNFLVTLAPASGSVFTNLASVGTVTPEISTANNTTILVSTQAVLSPAGISVGPASQTIQCGGNVFFSVVATGTPPLNVQWSLDSLSITGATNTSFSVTNLHLPSHIVAVTVTNLYGGATGNAVVTVIDTIPPVITLNGGNPFYVELGSTFADPGATATDVCAGVVGVVVSGAVNTNVVGTNLLTYTATDDGNTSMVTRTVIVRDTTPPTILWSFANLILAANSNCVALMPNVTGTNFILATDLSEPLTNSQSPTNGAILPLGTSVVVIAVADAFGNTACSTNTVVVQDQTPPVFLSQPQNLTNLPGTTADFSVAATACTPLAFQWYSNNAVLTAWTNSILSLSNVTPAATGNYFVVASASGGSSTSAVATLTVNFPPPVISGVAANPGGSFTLQLAGLPGHLYVLEATTNLLPPGSWLPVATNTFGTDGVWQFTDTSATNFPQQFYRLELPP